MNPSAVRDALDRAEQGLWAPEHLIGRAPDEVVVADLIALPVGWLAVGHAGADIVLSPVVDDGLTVRRARPGDGVYRAILDVIGGAVAGRLRGVRFGGSAPIATTERWIAVDQSNESIVVGDAVVVKFFPRTAPGPQPAVDLPAHLAAVGFAEIPAPIGAVTWGADVLVATACAYVPGARDGWEWFVELVQRATNDGNWREADRAVEAIGDIVARLHIALATPSDVVPRPTGVASASDVAVWRARAAAALDDAVRTTDGAAGERLAALEPRARAVLDRLASIDETPVQRIHGDLHVGQILRDDAGSLWVNDFDGNPLASVEARVAPDAAARDVAAMACAIDHVGRVVARREPAAVESLEAWIERARSLFLSAYREALGEHASLFDERLLAPFSVAQEAHEYRYAASYLPRWRYVPDAAMPAAIARAEASA